MRSGFAFVGTGHWAEGRTPAGKSVLVLRHVEARQPAPDQSPFSRVQIVPDVQELRRTRAQQFDGETHGSRPVAPHETPDDRVAFETAEQVFPDAPKGMLRLPGIDCNLIVPKQVQVQVFLS